MSRITLDLALSLFDGLTGQEYAALSKALSTQEDEELLVTNRRLESSQTIDLLSGFSHLRSVVVLAHFPERVSDLKNVVFSVTDSSANITTMESPYFINLEIPVGSYNAMSVQTPEATIENPINLKIIRLGN